MHAKQGWSESGEVIVMAQRVRGTGRPNGAGASQREMVQIDGSVFTGLCLIVFEGQISGNRSALWRFSGMVRVAKASRILQAILPSVVRNDTITVAKGV